MFERRSGRHWCEASVGHRYFHGLEEPMNSVSSLWIGGITLFSLLLDSGYVRNLRPSALLVFCAVLYYSHSSSCGWIFNAWRSISLSSTYYHATLSLFGQLLDELSLVWATIAGWLVWLPGTPGHYKPLQRTCIRVAVLSLGIVYTGICLLIPQFNAIFLMFSLVWIFGLVRKELTLFPVPSAIFLAKYGLIIGSLGIGFWVYEQFNCHQLLHLGFPYFHSLWHVLAGTAIHLGMLFCQYCDAFKNHHSPKILWFCGAYPYLQLSPGAEKATHSA